ncbi:hypothetical protein IWZ03DRAFT_377423 [Phyllosticta citriasiana]|uniref:Secreted protein n=1 Tax=Phyllosticta citriasiana TaxID=595635 RepID=A0ABR1KN30_9PEZI
MIQESGNKIKNSTAGLQWLLTALLLGCPAAIGERHWHRYGKRACEQLRRSWRCWIGVGSCPGRGREQRHAFQLCERISGELPGKDWEHQKYHDERQIFPATTDVREKTRSK